MSTNYIAWFDALGMQDIAKVGGKNASLGEMISHLGKIGIEVPPGFAITIDAFYDFLRENNILHYVSAELSGIDLSDLGIVAECGAKIRGAILAGVLPTKLVDELYLAYHALIKSGDVTVAVRSSATAEDLPDASFAGQQETYLNVSSFHAVLEAIKQVYASLFNDRAISYRFHKGFMQHEIAISVGIQLMVRSDLASSGVMFSLDTESGFKEVVFITSAYGLGEAVVQGEVNPDEFYVHKRALIAKKPAVLRRNLGSKQIKMVYGGIGEEAVVTKDVPLALQRTFSLTDNEVEALAYQAILIERHYGVPMDIEWAKDGITGRLYILQARPETVVANRDNRVIEKYELQVRGELLVSGRSIGQKIGVGRARILKSVTDINKVQPGDVLVTDMTDPNWEPIMKKAAAIVTNRGGRTCHAAIIARELGIPAVVGCNNATSIITDGQLITVSCAEGEVGFVYAGSHHFELRQMNLDIMPVIPLKMMLNVGNPDSAFNMQNLPNAGVGLARLEFIINRMIGVHPKACLGFVNLPDETKRLIEERMHGYTSATSFYVDKLIEGVATLAAAFYPNKVIVRLSDFKTNEYANLIGGSLFEPIEENPMLGFRGAARYISTEFRECFALECAALKHVRFNMGFDNIEIMVPFVRTLTEAATVIELLASYGLSKETGVKILMMCEVPSNALLAERFLEYFDGFSIGSNDLTQLTLGIDRDSGLLANSFDERDPAVKVLLEMAINACKKHNKYIGICGQGPSDHPELAKWLMQQNIDSISLNPDTVLETWLYLAKENLK